MDIGFQLIKWYLENKRDLPWRNTNDPYVIWLSEIILQQTKVEQGLPYFENFLSRYPTIYEFAMAKEEEILKLWQGLGYYSRARNMHMTANWVVCNLEGKFPKNYADLIKLKGIGPYTAAAIASFSSNEKVAVVDGNVFRFLARLFSIEVQIDSSKAKKHFTEIALELMGTNNPANFNQAIMEFGALYCKPNKPDCSNCIFNTICSAYLAKSVNEFPKKGKKNALRKRYFHYFVLKSSQNIYLNRREKKDIWQNMYDFPLIETKEKVSELDILSSPDLKKLLGNTGYTISKISEEFTHILSHQIIYAKFYVLDINVIGNSSEYQLVAESNLDNYPFPKLIDNFLKKYS